MTGYEVQQSSTSYPLVFLLILTSDHITGATGLTPTVTISKNGGAFASPSGAVAEIANGWYKVAGNATDTATLGPLILHASVATADPTDILFPVVAVNPQSTAYGLVLAKTTNITGLNDIAATAVVSAGAITTSSGAVSTVTTVTNQLTAAQIATGVWQDSTSGDFTTASSIGKSLYTSGVVPGAANGLFIAGSNTATTVNFTGNLSGSVGSVTSGVTVTTNNDKTGYSLTVAPPTAAAVATAVWTDVTGSDFTTTSSPGKILVTQLGGAFTTTTSSVYSTASLANAPTGGTAPTAAQVATAVWEDTTAGGDFATAGSIGKLIVTTGLTVASVTNGVTVSTNNDKTGYSLTTAPPTAAAVATAVWQDTTAGDFTVSTSPGKIIFAQLGGAFTTSSSSIYSGAALANAPTGGTAPTAAQNATAVWQDILLSSDFSTFGSVGAYVKTGLASQSSVTDLGSPMQTYAQPTGFLAATFPSVVSSYAGGAVASVSGAVGSVTGNVGGNVAGSVGSVTNPVILLLTQNLSAARALDSIADTSLTLNDVFHCAVAEAVGKQNVTDLHYTVMTPSTGTVLRNFLIDNATEPTSRI